MNPPALRVECPSCRAHVAHPCRNDTGRTVPTHEARDLEYAGLSQALAFAGALRMVDRAMGDRRFDAATGQGRR